MMHFFHKYFFCCHQIMDTVKNIAVRRFNIYLAQVSSFQQNNTIGFRIHLPLFLGTGMSLDLLQFFLKIKLKSIAWRTSYINLLFYTTLNKDNVCIHANIKSSHYVLIKVPHYTLK